MGGYYTPGDGIPGPTPPETSPGAFSLTADAARRWHTHGTHRGTEPGLIHAAVTVYGAPGVPGHLRPDAEPPGSVGGFAPPNVVHNNGIGVRLPYPALV